MSEVLLTVETSVPSEALTQAMTARRWERWADGWFRCPFEHGFLDELTVLVRNDVVGAVGGRGLVVPGSGG